ncbi:MAG TPA: hypothetical protein VN911_04255 [Candidatus Acidoferrum sp.]|nr:hypothetical protein [Candidatus Acidoferrum sp.]
MLSRMSLGTKGALGFALILATSSGVTYYSVGQVAAISATADRTAKNTLTPKG